MTASDGPTAGPRMRFYAVCGGKWAAALKSASGQLETLAALFRTEAEARAYTAAANEALAARQRRLGPSLQPKGAKS